MARKLKPITHWKTFTDELLRSVSVTWNDAKRPPSIVQLTCEKETLRIPVFDGRPLPKDRIDTVPPELDKNMVQAFAMSCYLSNTADELWTMRDQDPESTEFRL